MPFKKLRPGDLEGVDKCPMCGSKDLLQDDESGEIICASCGFVVKEKVESTGPEWRAFSKDEKDNRSRVGTPTSLGINDMGLSTVMDRSNRDATGKSISGANKATYYRLRMWDSRSKAHEPADRNLRQAFNELNRLVDKLSVPGSVSERAAYIYRKALEKGLVRGRSISAIMAASLYTACRSLEVPRTLKDIAAVSNIKRKDIAKSYRLIVKELDLKMPVADPVKSVSRIATRVGLSERTSRKALDIIKKAMQSGISAGKDPMGLAAAALYVACVMEGENKTQKDIAEAAGVTEVTIRNRYKGLKSALNLPKE
jgi:transcription initiation factor TFIIB